MVVKRKIILGTMNFGVQNDYKESKLILEKFASYGYREVDTAYVYNNGQSEIILGNIFIDSSFKYEVATKVNPKVTGKLDKESILSQVATSLERMQIDSIDILYLHFPDNNTPILETLETCNDLYNKGKFKELGLSNFSAEMVKEIHSICEDRNWIKPSVYQGMYNALSRKVEAELFPLLRKLNIRFYAYNPLAGGLLSGKYLNFEEKPIEGRFQIRPNYLDRYWKQSSFNFINEIIDSIKKKNITLAEASLIWLANHSLINFDKGDAIIIGVSKINHLVSNINAIQSGQLDLEIVNLFDNLWNTVKDDSPEYYRYHDNKQKRS